MCTFSMSLRLCLRIFLCHNVINRGTLGDHDEDFLSRRAEKYDRLENYDNLKLRRTTTAATSVTTHWANAI